MSDSQSTWYNGNPTALSGYLDTLEMALTTSRYLDAQYLRDYHNSPVDGHLTVQQVLAGGEVAARAVQTRRRFSLLRAAIDSYAAMVVSVPSVDVVTAGGSWAQRRAAELLGGFVDGVFWASDMEALTWQVVIDSCLTRVAAARVEVDAGCAVKVSRVLPHFMLYNPEDGADPGNLAIRTPTSLSALVAAHPEKAGQLKDQARRYKPDPLYAGIDGYSPELVSGDKVLLDEAWHLPDPDEPETGRYLKMVGDVSLNKGEDGDPWRHSWFPVVPLRFDWSYSSFGGRPAADTLISYQAMLDEYAQNIQEAYGIAHKVRWFADNESGLDAKTLHPDMNGRVVFHAPGKMPQRDVTPALHPEYLQREETIIRRGYEFMGLNFDVARGVKADGIASGKGQREVISLAHNRQVLRMRAVQSWLMRVAETVIRVADDAYDKNSKAVVKAPGTKTLRRISWSDIDYDEDLFTVRVDAINALSRHPAARVEEINDLVKNKMVEPREGLKLVGVKDLQALRDEAFAPDDYAESMIDLALGGDQRTPDVYLGEEGLQQLIRRGKRRYLAESVQKEPSEHLGMLRELIEAAQAVLKEITPPAAEVPPGAPPGGPAMPGDPAQMGAPGALPIDPAQAAALPPGLAPDPLAAAPAPAL